MEPMLVNTVSYFKVSALVLNLAVADVIKESFLQEKRKKQNAKSKEPKKQYFRNSRFIFQK